MDVVDRQALVALKERFDALARRATTEPGGYGHGLQAAYELCADELNDVLNPTYKSGSLGIDTTALYVRNSERAGKGEK